MFLKNPELIKPEKKSIVNRYQKSRLPQARNPIYQKNINVGCPYCTDKSGRKKNFKTLFCLYMHFRIHHIRQPNFKELTMSIADLIIKGVLL